MSLSQTTITACCLWIRLNLRVTDCIILIVQLKYHDTGREKDCLPRVGQWNMMNKVLH